MRFGSYHTSALASAATCLVFGAAAVEASTPQSNVTLYAYGVGPGVPIIYSDGFAYFGWELPANASKVSNITFTIDPTDTDRPWTIQPSGSNVTFDAGTSLYIKPNLGSFTQVGFATNGTLPAGAVNTGFSTYGGEVAYAGNPSSFEFRFFGKITDVTNLFALYWGDDGVSIPEDQGIFPIHLKTSKPVFPDLPPISPPINA